MEQVIVGNLMEQSVVTVGTDATLAEAVHRLEEHDVSSIVVVEGKRPVGIVTERDLVQALGALIEERCTKRQPVSDFMSAPLVTVEQSTPLFEALVVVKSRKIRHLPVVDGEGLLRGILSYSGLARAYEHIIEQQREIIEQEHPDEAPQLSDVSRRLKSLSMEDALLGIGNRRSMGVDLTYTHSVAIRYRRPYSVVLYDIDHFGSYNEHYGTGAGDDALKLVTEHIRCAVRRGDRLYRYDGGRVLLLLPETEYRGAAITAERIAHELAERNVPHAKSPLGVLTLSGGVVSPDVADEVRFDWQTVVSAAERALADAKAAGCNRTECALVVNE